MDASRTAFVTGGSGFIGGVLLPRLAREGWRVRALARSEASAEKVESAGAEAVRGDLEDTAAIRTGAEGCEVAFHAAAAVGEWGRREEFERANVTGTRNVLDACAAAGVRRLVHVGTEAAVTAGEPLVGIDESSPLRPDSKSDYCATKAMAEQAVLAANDGMETIVLRPRFVWGPGDTTILPGIVEAVEGGRFSWIGGGHHLTSTTHVENVVEGLVLAAKRGRPGEAYFVTDGEPLEFRAFITRLLATRGVEAPDRNTPAPLARLAAPVCEALWRGLRLKGEPPVTRMALWVSSLELTIDISKAREQLEYKPVRGVDEGLAELATAG